MIPETKNFQVGTDPKMQCTCCSKGGLGFAMLVFLEHLKEHYEGKAVHINSGPRCSTYNKSVGGSKNSEHLTTPEEPLVDTADVRVDGVSTTALHSYIKSLPYANLMGIGLYVKDGFVHCDFRGYPARWKA